MSKLFRLSGATPHCLAVDEWLSGNPVELYTIARRWFNEIRDCGEAVGELIHDGCPVACVEDAAFAYVNVYKSHVSIGFFLGAYLSDPEGLLEGTGKQMRHIKLRPQAAINNIAVTALIHQAYSLVVAKLR